MATPEYFSYFPNVEYAYRMNAAGQPRTISIKDYFHLMTLREDIYKYDTIYDAYEIKLNERPDMISKELYDDEQFYWVILQVNDIVDYHNQWPLAEPEFYTYVVRKYGSEAKANEPHHYITENIYRWETFAETEAADERMLRKNMGLEKDIVFPGGMVVAENYKYPVHLGISNRKPFTVTNLEYERELNDRKRFIQVVKEEIIYDFVRDYQNYAESIPPQKSEVGIVDYRK